MKFHIPQTIYNPDVAKNNKFLFIMCLILPLSIWISLLGRQTSIGNSARAGFLSSINVSQTEVTEKASCESELFCELEGDIRVEAKSGTIYVMTHNETISNSTDSWVIRPYVRWYMHQVRHWTVKVVRYSEEEKNAPKCTQKYYNPAILFSGGGHSVNNFHCYADVIFPLYMTSFGYQQEVHFLVTDYIEKFISKTNEILHGLSRYPIVEIDNENEQVHCYHKMFVGLKFHGDLIVDKTSLEYAAGISMHKFRQFLRGTYSLERPMAIDPRLVNSTRPRLMIISRKMSRILSNEDEISRVANEVGFNVVSTEADLSTNLSRFAQIVNSCDVMLGVHGAGLTNMLFLPDNAVVIQIIPYGPIDYFAGVEFRDPSWGMNISYLDYKISVEESTLSQQYAPDDPILTDPNSYYAKGFGAIWSVYLHNVNFTVDVKRFKDTLVEAMKLLRD